MYSKYTAGPALRHESRQALEYLYFNSKLNVNSEREEFAASLSTSTICNHIRILHYISWFCDRHLLDTILYCITDSKAAVMYLRHHATPQFDHGWWKTVPIYNSQDKHDGFYALPAKSASSKPENILLAEEIMQRRGLPISFSCYKFLLEFEVSKFQQKPVASSALWRETVLTIVFMRHRIDRKIIEYERSSS